MSVLLWVVRALIVLFVLRLVLRLLFGSGRLAPGRQAPPGRPAERSGGELVRDPQCGTYVPRGRAIAVGSGPETKYFCSTACRDAHGGSRPV